MSEAEAPVLVGRDGAVGRMTLNRPDKFNCLNGAMWRLIGDAFAGFEADRSVRAVLIDARGTHFCTGADLNEVVERRAEAARVAEFNAFGHDVLRRFEASRLPVVVAVQGLALAGGLELMLGCDVAIAAETAQFGDQHARYGLPPGWGSTQRLPRIVGPRRALDLLLSARWIDAATAERWGLVNLVAPDAELGRTALDYTARVARGNPDGLGFMKRMARQGLAMSLPHGLALEEAAVVRELMTENVAEGLAAFRARREPNFS